MRVDQHGVKTPSFPQVWPLTHTKGPFRVGWTCGQTSGGIPQHCNLFIETDLTTRVLSISHPWINNLGESERHYTAAGLLRFHPWKFSCPFTSLYTQQFDFECVSWPKHLKKVGSRRVLTEKLLMVVVHWKPWKRSFFAAKKFSSCDAIAPTRWHSG